jgi:hypothetical protein
LLRSPLDRARSVLTDRAMCSVACSGLGFLYQRFSSLLRDEACQFRNQQSRTVVKFGDHSSIGDSWPIAFSGCPRGTRVGCETCARGTQRLTNQLRLALEPECLENPTATAREIPRDGAESIRNTQAVCGFRYWASKHAPLFHTINTMVAIFLAKVRRAISGRMPLASNAV